MLYICDRRKKVAIKNADQLCNALGDPMWTFRVKQTQLGY